MARGGRGIRRDGLTPRRWRIVTFLAMYGSASVRQVALAVGVPRLTAHRDLLWLHEAGLVERDQAHEDPAHAWWYDTTDAGLRRVTAAFEGAGRPVPLQLGQRVLDATHYLLFMALLEVASRDPQRCALYQWLPRMDTSVWLRQYDLAHLRAHGYGIWLEGGRALRFLVHLDEWSSDAIVAETERHTVGLDALLAGYRRDDRAVPVGAVLIIAQNEDRERELLAKLVQRPLKAPIATTNRQLLRQYWPSEQVWRTPDRPQRCRLIDLAP